MTTKWHPIDSHGDNGVQILHAMEDGAFLASS